MNAFREYAVSLIATTLICTAVSSLLQNSAAKEIVRMVTGIILTVSIAAPLWNLDISVSDIFESLVPEGANTAAAVGENLSEEALRAIIKEQTQAYIQDKAAGLHADITAEVILTHGDPPIPEKAVISGRISPYAKQQLQEILQTQLGIPKENLEWTG